MEVLPPVETPVAPSRARRWAWGRRPEAAPGLGRGAGKPFTYVSLVPQRIPLLVHEAKRSAATVLAGTCPNWLRDVTCPASTH